MMHRLMMCPKRAKAEKGGLYFVIILLAIKDLISVDVPKLGLILDRTDSFQSQMIMITFFQMQGSFPVFPCW